MCFHGIILQVGINTSYLEIGDQEVARKLIISLFKSGFLKPIVPISRWTLADKVKVSYLLLIAKYFADNTFVQVSLSKVNDQKQGILDKLLRDDALSKQQLEAVLAIPGLHANDYTLQLCKNDNQYKGSEKLLKQYIKNGFKLKK